MAIYKIDTNLNVSPYVNEMMNATGLALDSDGILYVSSRADGTVYQVAPNGSISTYAEGMGVATGIAFDHERNLYVGDRSGTIFKIATDRQISVYATLEPKHGGLSSGIFAERQPLRHFAIHFQQRRRL